ncbi:MAG TPA: hypothetical protein VJH65_03635 [Candidatus Nanoarchaeia archaeon]|nr:hypothetical protein [Candidatus Nanoarchaeia archaeon]
MLEFLIPLIAFSGLIFGILLSKISPEEMKSGKKYFNYLKKIALAVLVISLIFLTAPFSWYVLLGLIIGYISALLLKRVYFFLGLALLLSFLTFNPNFTLLVSSLIFIFGLPLGSLINMELKKRKDIYFLVLFNLLFFLAPLLLLFVQDLFVYNLIFPLAFTAGSLLYLIRY